jgi:hypothetical protein
MKYYETTFEDYLQAVQKCNFHPELPQYTQSIPTTKDVIFYGPSGVGKYSQVLKYLQPHSPSQLSYYKKITVFIDRVKNKTPYTLFMSDIHFEIDLSILGCNAKKVWHEIFVQLVDIMKLREHKHGFLVCKNFHTVHSELLEIFYSYMQHYRPREISLPTSGNMGTEVQITFILLTEHLSFIPNPIYQSSCLVPVCRPPLSLLEKGISLSPVLPAEKDDTPEESPQPLKTAKSFLRRIHLKKTPHSHYAAASGGGVNEPFLRSLLHAVDSTQVLNMKEYQCFNLLPTTSPLTPPSIQHHSRDSSCRHGNEMNKIIQIQQSLGHLSEDIFNKVCDQIIEKITQIPVQGTAKWFASFRDALYSILICNLDASECVCYVLQHFIYNPPKTSPFTSSSSPPGISTQSVTRLMQQMYPFLLYYNNNYRPIYHLEMIFLRLVVELYHFYTL